MKKSWLFAVLLIVFSSYYSASSQELSWKRFTVNDGLLQSQISQIYQDSKGYMWIASRLGISRFDGIHFSNYTEKDGLFGRWAIQITEDNEGNIWFLYHEGISRFDGHSFQSFSIADSIKNHRAIKLVPYAADSVSIFKLTENNTLIEVVFREGRFAIDKQFQLTGDTESWTYLMEPRYVNKSKTLWFMDLSGGLYLYKSGDVQKVQGFSEKIQGYEIGQDGKCYGISGGSLFVIENGMAVKLFNNLFSVTDQFSQFKLAIDRLGNIIVCPDNEPGAKMISGKNRQITNMRFPILTTLTLDRDGNLWAGTENGLYHANSWAFINYLPEKEGMHQNVWSVVEGKNEVMYFASYYDGLQALINGEFVEIDGLPRYSSSQRINLAMGSITDAQKTFILRPVISPWFDLMGKTSKHYPKG